MTTRFTRSPEVLMRRTATSIIIRRLEGTGVTLGGTGTMLWDLLAEPQTAAELTDVLRARHDDPDEVVERDLDAVLRSLLDQGVIVLADEA